MVLNIETLMNKPVPKQGLYCSVQGYFFYYIARNPPCEKPSAVYLSASSDGKGACVLIPNHIGDVVRNAEGAFCGGLVGGVFAYAGIKSIVKGTVVWEGDNLTFSDVKSISLKQSDKEAFVEIKELR